MRLLFELFAGPRIATVAALFAAVIVYFVSLILLGGVTEKELLMVPKGRSIVRMLKKFHLIHGGR